MPTPRGRSAASISVSSLRPLRSARTVSTLRSTSMSTEPGSTPGRSSSTTNVFDLERDNARLRDTNARLRADNADLVVEAEERGPAR